MSATDVRLCERRDLLPITYLLAATTTFVDTSQSSSLVGDDALERYKKCLRRIASEGLLNLVRELARRRAEERAPPHHCPAACVE